MPPRLQENPDLVWMNEAGKYAGIRAKVEEAGRGDAAAILVVSHFDNTHAQIERLLANYNGPVPAKAVKANDLSLNTTTGSQFEETSTIEVIFAERHPLIEEDEGAVNEFADQLPCRCRVTHCVSFEDALMRSFVDSFVENVMSRMGMKEDEAIESLLVSRRIRAAQEQISKNVVSRHKATSAQEWIDKNVRQNRD
ncbi:preprotein translocase subunit SecA [Rhodopirellula sp. SWK7]|uniref:preprotein translocase subunit SecA n=1 Tax=Rhodopirellula sp. SWK7 TaxID=595460 RepID=UPI0002BF40CA|nr:preprotein translocase subunit SecA [Rhodopirellula sp. SWK7]EMI40558.1 preprotein translocase subunit SecA [Rhodopirellula sp. SWK7]